MHPLRSQDPSAWPGLSPFLDPPYTLTHSLGLQVLIASHPITSHDTTYVITDSPLLSPFQRNAMAMQQNGIHSLLLSIHLLLLLLPLWMVWKLERT